MANPKNKSAKKENKSPKGAEPPAGSPPEYDPALGQQALESLRARRDALREDNLASTRVDVEAGALRAIGVVGFVTEPEMYKRFASLPAAEFDIANVDELQSAAFATIYAYHEAKREGAFATDAKLPASVIDAANEVEARMQRVCEYHLSDDPEISPELDRLRPGTGHRDTAGDLLGYARIYKLRKDIVAADPKHYRETDADEANKLAGMILAAYAAAMSPKAKEAQSTLARSWTLLYTMYEEVRQAGLWLCRKNSKREELFPSLFAAARAVGRTSKGKGKGPAEGGDGAETGTEGGDDGE